MSFSIDVFSGGICGNIVASFVADIKWVTEVYWCVCERERETDRVKGGGKRSQFKHEMEGVNIFPLRV